MCWISGFTNHSVSQQICSVVQLGASTPGPLLINILGFWALMFKIISDPWALVFKDILGSRALVFKNTLGSWAHIFLDILGSIVGPVTQET